ncbi:NUDIX domain-containing protein [Halomonas sp. AOP43-D1-4]|uniref:NUDIX domain-containing protein n=1 Tax=Halomonas sp. AOP43-D1-4 TaxID=3457658 RepID=UPI004033AD7F
MYPVSIKGVLLLPANKVVLGLNDRDEWELPGGRIEIGEVSSECLEREFEEELAVKVVGQEIIDSYLFEVIPQKHVFIVTYGCCLVGEFNPTVSHEHSRIDAFPVDNLPHNLPAGYAQSINAWCAMQGSLISDGVPQASPPVLHAGHSNRNLG